MLRRLIPSITELHDACTVALNKSHEYYMGNKAYNHYVVNGEHLPENLGEEVEYQISLVNMPNKIKQAYLKACWINDNFFYPPKEEVASMLFRV
jgi:hypothetical protein